MKLTACLLLLLSSAWANADRAQRSKGTKPCGLDGAIKSRVSDCEDQRNDAIKVIQPALYADYNNDPLGGLDEPDREWRLVTEDKDGVKVWLDVSSGLLWGGFVETLQPQADQCALAAVKSNLKVEFHIPTEEEFRTAQLNGLRGAVDLDRRVFHIAGTKDKFFNGSNAEFLDAEKLSKLTPRPLAVICTAVGAKPRPPKKKERKELIDP